MGKGYLGPESTAIGAQTVCTSADTNECSEHRPVTRLDRVIWPLWAVSGLGAGSAFVVGLVLAVWLPGLKLFPTISWWLLIPCVVLDLCNLYVVLTGIVRGGGPSAIPLIAWAYYVLFSLFGPIVAWRLRLAVLAALTVFHGCCHFPIPWMVARRIEKRRGT